MEGAYRREGGVSPASLTPLIPPRSGCLRERRRRRQLLALRLVDEDLAVHLDVGVEAHGARLGGRQSETDYGDHGDSKEKETTTH